MIPSVLAAQVKRGVEEFLLTTFPITSRFFAGRLERLVRRGGAEGIFRGPFLSLGVPFVTGDAAVRHFPDIVPGNFTPHRHQQIAWGRLAAPSARSTVIATGTGTGKTECFLFPILDYCLRTAGRAGIKAIVVYPMNALATDQARRFAETIWRNERLKGRVRVGLYIGADREDRKRASAVMTEETVITDRDAMRRLTCSSPTTRCSTTCW